MTTLNSGNKIALYIDTSGEEAQVALIRGDEIVGNTIWLIGLVAGKEVLEKVNEVMNESNIGLSGLERIAVKNGPGRKSSTLRSGVTVASFLALVSGAVLVVVDDEAEGGLAEKVFSASFNRVITLNYDRPGFADNRKKA